MKTGTIILSATLSACLLIAVSCNKTLDNIFTNQETRIESIVSSLTASNDSATVTYNGGATRVTMSEGSGPALTSSGTVSFWYAGYYLTSASISSSNLFATNAPDLFGLTWEISDSTILAIKTADLAADDLIEGLKMGLEGVTAGEECYVLFSGKHGFGSRITGTVPANSALAYHLLIDSVSE